ncbi:MAG: C45 family peptidase [Candidatus Latescibacterota bacterium]|nr:C45 family peptidase [Candidatus Latescibacterota bacterium]
MNQFPLVIAEGSAYSLGLHHGEQAASLIQCYLRYIEKTTSKGRDELAVCALSFEPLIAELSPAYLDEVRGLADGAGISYGEAMVCQVRGAAVVPADADGCTAFALTSEATRTGETLAGQNQDLPPEFSDFGIVLHLKPDDGRPRVVTFTFAGQLGYMGMNSVGVAHFANGLGNAPARRGLTHYPLKRRCFEMSTVDECVGLLRRFRACSAGNMVFCDGDGGVADVEIRPDSVAVYDDEHECRRLHTNHYVTEEFADFEDGNIPDSVPRLDRIRALVAERWGEINVEVLQEMLADHSGDPDGICRHGGKGIYSIAGYIAQPAQGVLHVRRGLGCTGTWSTYEV